MTDTKTDELYGIIMSDSFMIEKITINLFTGIDVGSPGAEGPLPDGHGLSRIPADEIPEAVLEKLSGKIEWAHAGWSRDRRTDDIRYIKKSLMYEEISEVSFVSGDGDITRIGVIYMPYKTYAAGADNVCIKKAIADLDLTGNREDRVSGTLYMYGQPEEPSYYPEAAFYTEDKPDKRLNEGNHAYKSPAEEITARAKALGLDITVMRDESSAKRFMGRIILDPARIPYPVELSFDCCSYPISRIPGLIKYIDDRLYEKYMDELLECGLVFIFRGFETELIYDDIEEMMWAERRYEAAADDLIAELQYNLTQKYGRTIKSLEGKEKA